MRISANGSREVGIFVSSSVVKLVAVPVALVSTTGDSPLTVIVSATDAIFSVIGSSTLLPTATMTFSRTTVVKPGSVAVTVYGPGARFRNRYSPPASVDERQRGVDALRGDRDAGQHAALFVLDGAADAAALDLRERGQPRTRDTTAQQQPRNSIVSFECSSSEQIDGFWRARRCATARSDVRTVFASARAAGNIRGLARVRKSVMRSSWMRDPRSIALDAERDRALADAQLSDRDAARQFGRHSPIARRC